MDRRVRIYTALAEIRPLSGSELDANLVAGAFVRCHIPAIDAEAAIQTLAGDLADRAIQLIETEWCVDHDKTEWENPKDDAEQALVDAARKSGCVIYGDFHTWGHNAPDAT